ncbi:MAG: 30S ribosomal protein S3 [Phycisphaerae bacterium]|nr:30S ribosomal protein S3 [Phycisphaerae bacterium]
MGQKVNPTGFRTGITIGWKSRWFAPKSNYGEFLVEDARIRKFLDTRLNRTPPFAAVSEIEIERTREEVKVILKTARPGIVIGPKGIEVENIKNALEDLTNRRVNVNIVEIRNPDLDAQLIAEGIAEQLKRRSSFRRTMKTRAEASMQCGAKGIKIMLSGRLGGAEMSRSESITLGSVPLHTLEADVHYGFVPCFTTYGCIGVKVWIYRGLFGEQPTEEELAKQRFAGTGRGRRRHTEGGGRGQGQRGQARPSKRGQSRPAPAAAAPAVPAESAPAAPAKKAPAAPAEKAAPAPEAPAKTDE